MPHHAALLAAYASTLLGWAAAARVCPGLWPKREPIALARPWLEIGLALMAVVAVLALGQLYVRDWLIPRTSGQFSTVVDAANQAIIFAPVFMLLLVRRQSLATAWLPSSRIWMRVGTGLILALVAVLVYSMVREGSRSWFALVPEVFRPGNLSHLVQVFCEDVAIAVLFVRFRAAIGIAPTIALVASLFALGHVPALLANGATLAECTALILDVGLGVVVLSVLHRSADVWWFFLIHFAMDMMQF